MTTTSRLQACDLDETDLAPAILHALAGQAPEQALHAQFPWMRPELLHDFVQDAVPLQNAGSADLELLVQRFAHTIRCERGDIRIRALTPAEDWPRLASVASLTAVLFTAIGVWR